MTSSPFLVCMSHSPGDLLLVPLPPRLQIEMMTFPVCIFQSALLWFCVNVMKRFLLRAPLLPFPHPLPVPFFAPRLPCRLVAVADALLGMINIDLRLLFLLLLPRFPAGSDNRLSQSNSAYVHTNPEVECKLDLLCGKKKNQGRLGPEDLMSPEYFVLPVS
jgi:hypothetical protein